MTLDIEEERLRFLEMLVLTAALIVSLGVIPNKTFFIGTFAGFVLFALGYFFLEYYRSEIGEECYRSSIFLTSTMIGLYFATVIGSLFLKGASRNPVALLILLKTIIFMAALIAFAITVAILSPKEIIIDLAKGENRRGEKLLLSIQIILIGVFLLLSEVFLFSGGT